MITDLLELTATAIRKELSLVASRLAANLDT